jgi:hypothetical protein
MALGRQVRGDFLGQGSFLYWAAAIGMAGAIGYVPQLRRLSIALMGLVLLVLLLKHSDFFSKFTAGIRTGPARPSVGSGVNPTGSVAASAAGASNASSGKGISAVIPFANAIPGVNELPSVPDLSNWDQFSSLLN